MIEKFIYVIFLEIIYLNLLYLWNLYKFEMKNEIMVIENGCIGDVYNVYLVYNGIFFFQFYQILFEFFGNIVGQEVGVLDFSGFIYCVMVFGIQIILLNIFGVGVVR